MTQAEKIKMLEAELKAERLEHEKAKAEIKEYKKRDETCAIVERGEAGHDGYGFWQDFLVRSFKAPYGTGAFSFEAFHKALTQFINKWNEAAREACMKNEFKKPKKGGKK